MVESSGQSLATTYDLLMFDLDGVVYVDGRAVDQAPQSIGAARESGAHVAFITNNASRTPAKVAEHLQKLGIDAAPTDVVTSSQAAASVLLAAHGPGARVAVLGAEGLVRAVAEAGLEPVDVGDSHAAAIVSGYAPDVRWRVIMNAATLIRNGLPWYATNADLTLPTGAGLAPGHGYLVRLISDFAEVTPHIAGKPQRPLFDETRRRVQGQHPLMVGDRLDTDIEGGRDAGVDTLLVMTGVSGLVDVLAAPPERRPTWLGHDLTALGRPGCSPSRDGDVWTASSWSASVEDGRLSVVGSGDSAADRDAWWTAVAHASWAHLDDTGTPPAADGVTVPGGDAAAG